MRKLKGMRVAILVADGFEQVELTRPRTALEDAGAYTEIVSPAQRYVKGWSFTNWGRKFRVNVPLEEADARHFDALLLPGGVLNPDTHRLHPKAIAFIKAFADADKPIASICHGPWTLINAGIARGRTLTSWPSLEVDLRNAGADWVDQQVVRDGRLITSRKPDDIPAFNSWMLDLFAEHCATATQRGAEAQAT
ncbi:MAG TPA: type 1 glutamine amidotransferase domain-containing protein [Polyangiaceae bacterium]